MTNRERYHYPHKDVVVKRWMSQTVDALQFFLDETISPRLKRYIEQELLRYYKLGRCVERDRRYK